MEILTWIGIAVTAAILSLTIRPHQPVFAFLTALAAGLCLLAAAGQAAGELLAAAKALVQAAGIPQTVYMPVIKAVGIATAVRIAGAICQDAGQSALAVKLELAGGIAALLVCLPLVEQLLELTGGLLQ